MKQVEKRDAVLTKEQQIERLTKPGFEKERQNRLVRDTHKNIEIIEIIENRT